MGHVVTRFLLANKGRNVQYFPIDKTYRLISIKKNAIVKQRSVTTSPVTLFLKERVSDNAL